MMMAFAAGGKKPSFSKHAHTRQPHEKKSESTAAIENWSYNNEQTTQQIFISPTRLVPFTAHHCHPVAYCLVAVFIQRALVCHRRAYFSGKHCATGATATTISIARRHRCRCVPSSKTAIIKLLNFSFVLFTSFIWNLLKIPCGFPPFVVPSLSRTPIHRPYLFMFYFSVCFVCVCNAMCTNALNLR